MNKIFIAGSFLIGAATGAIGMRIYISKKNEAYLAKMESEIRADIVNANKILQEKKSPKKDESADILENEPEKSKYSDIITKYVSKEDVALDDFVRERFGPRVISPDKFDEYEDYTVISLTYYADGVLCDETNDIIDDIEECIGKDAISSIGLYEDDCVHVRNDIRKCYYEVLKSELTYKEANPLKNGDD